MSQPAKLTDPQVEKKTRRKPQPEQPAQRRSAAEVAPSPLGRAPTPDAQASLLARLPAAQRQVALQRMSQTQGNQHVQRTVAAMQSQREEEVAAAPQTYTVQPGETLAILAQKLGTTVETLVSANQDQLKTWNIKGKDIQGFNAGAKISLPAPGGAQPEPGLETQVTKEREDLWDVAADFVDDVIEGAQLVWSWLFPPTEEEKKSQELQELMAQDRLSVEQVARARELIEQIPDEKEQGDMYQLLQSKVQYANQRDNQAKLNGQIIETKSGGLCNLTSLAMALQYLGVPNPHPDLQYEDALETVRQDKNFAARTGEGWEQVAKELGAEVEFLLGRGADQAHNQEWYQQTVLPEIRGGAGIIMSIKGHIVRLQDVTETGLVVDDPYGRLDLGKRIEKGGHGGYEAYNQSQWGTGGKENEGEDSVWTWKDVKRYPMWWIAAIKKP